MAGVDLIYVADGNRRLAEIAVKYGWLYGARSGTTYYLPPAFLDLDHRRPDFARHLAECQRWRPRYAVAGDAETNEQLEAVLHQAEQLAPYAERVIVVPKRDGMVERIPERYVIGYSVPTRFGGTQATAWEYRGRRLHLLGGSPQRQLRLYAHFGPHVISVDGNSHNRAAVNWGSFWQAGGWISRQRAAAVEGPGPDLPYRAFERSCQNIAAAWRQRRAA